MDLEAVIRVDDPYLKKNRKQNGPIIHAPATGIWDSIAAKTPHLRFAMPRHCATTRIALVADAARRIAPHFVNAKIKTHPAAKPEQARTRTHAGAYN